MFVGQLSLSVQKPFNQIDVVTIYQVCLLIYLLAFSTKYTIEI